MGARLKAVKGPSGRLHLCRHGRQLRRCGCGGQGCCYCVDINAIEGECDHGTFGDYSGFYGKCGPDKCCCGKSWEYHIAGSCASVYRPGGGNEDNRSAEYELRIRFTECGAKKEVLKDYVRYVINGKETVKEPGGLATIGQQWGVTRYCRPSAEMAATIAGFIQDHYLGAYGLGFVVTGFHDGPCEGQVDFPYGYRRWSGGGTCKSGQFTYLYASNYEPYGQTVDATADGVWEVTLLDSDCCGPQGPTPTTGAPNANPPGNPGQPGAGMGECPRCGGSVRSDGKCAVCGHCGGCGG